MHKLCPFCHTWLSTHIFDEHLASHTRLLPDGQQQDHVTVRPEARFAGDIAKEPRWYVHPLCGGVTGMPEEIIRSYMADPFLYNETSFCTGCGTYVPTAELYWQETNESLHASSYRRKAEFIQRNHLNPDDFVWDASGPARRKGRGGGAGWGIAALAVGGVAALCLLGFVFLIGLYSVRAQAGRKRQAAPPLPVNAGMPDFNRDFPRMEMPEMEIPKGPDMKEIMREHNQRMEEIRKQNDELLEKLRPEGFGQPGGFGRPPDIGPPNLGPAGFDRTDPLSGIEGARQRAKEARERAQERMDAMQSGQVETLDQLFPGAGTCRPDRPTPWGVCLAAVLVVGCEERPVASTPTPIASSNSPAASSSTQPAASGPAAPGFSLPIGGDIQPLPATSATSTVPLPPLPAQVPAGGNAPQEGAIQVPTIGLTPADSAAPAIHLSAGVAVPQSLPTGTAMGVSVDYRARGTFSGSSRYVFVVKSAAGEAVNEVQLESSGTLAAFFLELKPEHRPFTVRIEELTSGSLRRVLSNELTLKTDY